MSEEIVTFGNTRSLVGVLHRPDDGAANSDLPAVLLLNAGILHRVGPNRLYVEIARRLARNGFNVLRFDVWGIGDSQDHSGPRTSRTFFDDTVDAMNLLQQQLGATRFMLMGICMGAQIALEVASRDIRVDSLVLMEGIYLKSARYYVSRLLDPDKWKRIVTGQSHFVKQVRSRVGKLLGRKKGGGPKPPGAGKSSLVLFLDERRDRNVTEKLNGLLRRGARILLVFRDGNEIAYNYRLRRIGDDIVAHGLPAGLEVEFVRFADHTFTPLVSQELLLNIAMRWIARTHPSRARETRVKIVM